MKAYDVILGVVSALVDDPGKVKIRTLEGEKNTVFELSVAKPDLGKVIGRKGKMAGALRIILTGIGGKDGRNYALEIID